MMRDAPAGADTAGEEAFWSAKAIAGISVPEWKK
jgi:hypothetical protein